MLQPDIRYTKVRWLLTIAGVFLYVGDIWTDIVLAVKYFQEEQYVWTGFTVMFILIGLLVTQIFSYAWYWDDLNDPLLNPEGKKEISDMSKPGLVVLHAFGFGIFTRYAIKITAFMRPQEVHKKLFCVATDLSMLKLFETFLESAPQLLLQLYILLGHNEILYTCLSVAFSFCNIAWSLVDYRRCLRRSLPYIREMPSGLPTAIYLLYKICTITSLILSYSLLLILSIYTTVVLTVLWLLATIWTHLLETKFCSSRSLEFLYRAVAGVILTFTFFNVKGQDTKVAMTTYYIFCTVINIMSPSLMALLKPELQTSTLLLTISGLICGCSVLGLVCLILYYVQLHPRRVQREEDEVDDPGKETKSLARIKNFLKP
uniref:XK-related protein n=1 Tax=Maylandia zebra TaxID=106582 RepID=A0A3P9D2R9_9CICH